jgi:hypothetical protein
MPRAFDHFAGGRDVVHRASMCHYRAQMNRIQVTLGDDVGDAVLKHRREGANHPEPVAKLIECEVARGCVVDIVGRNVLGKLAQPLG